MKSAWNSRIDTQWRMRLLCEKSSSIVFSSDEGTIATLDVNTGVFTVIRGPLGLGYPIDMLSRKSFVFASGSNVSWVEDGRIVHRSDLPPFDSWFESIVSVGGSAFVQTEVDGMLCLRDLRTLELTPVSLPAWHLAESMFSTYRNSKLFAYSVRDTAGWGVLDARVASSGLSFNDVGGGEYVSLTVSSSEIVSIADESGVDVVSRHHGSDGFHLVARIAADARSPRSIWSSLSSRVVVVSEERRVSQFFFDLQWRDRRREVYELDAEPDWLIGCDRGLVVCTGDSVALLVA